MKNAILRRWADVLARRKTAAAVYGPDGSVARTFAEIEAEADRLAARLAGGPAGAVVSVQAPNSPGWPALVLGIWRAGGCALLIDQAAGEGTRDAAERLCGAAVRLDGSGERSLAGRRADFGVPAPELIKLTSGTSGAPKAILFTAAQLAADGDQVCETMGIAERDLNYGVIAFSHSYGFSNLVVPLLCRGVPLVAAPDALPRAVLDGTAATGATVLPAVPAIFQALAGSGGGRPRGLRLCISAGAPLREDTAGRFRERFGLKIHTFYGASECGGIAYDASDGESPAPGFVGQPLRAVEIERLEGGEISVRSAAVGSGYFPPESDRLAAGAFRPADLLERTSEGWKITGRSTDVINIGGRKTTPAEIERVLLTHAAVREAVVFGVRSDRRTEAVWACVVAEGEAEGSSLRAHCARHLPAWQVPSEIVRLEAIPVNARGKVSRRELARQFGPGDA